MADRAGRAGDLGARRELPGAVLLEQIRRREDLGVLRQIADLVAGAADAAARREHAAVREQQRGRVVLARHRLRRERRPLARRRIPPLRVVDAAVHVDERCPGRVPARREDAAVGEQREVVLPTAEGHRRRGGDLGRRTVGVDHDARCSTTSRRRPRASFRCRRPRGCRSSRLIPSRWPKLCHEPPPVGSSLRSVWSGPE